MTDAVLTLTSPRVEMDPHARRPLASGTNGPLALWVSISTMSFSICDHCGSYLVDYVWMGVFVLVAGVIIAAVRLSRHR